MNNMKNFFLFFAILLTATGTRAQSLPKHALVLHGGAGVMSEKTMTPDGWVFLYRSWGILHPSGLFTGYLGADGIQAAGYSESLSAGG